jgi:hypothetical protein
MLFAGNSLIRSVLPTHLSDFAGLSTSKSLKGAKAKIGAWRGNTFAHCCAGWLANCADTNTRQREQKDRPGTKLSAGPGPRCPRLPLLAREFVRQPTNVI